jgi:hypothetical protein
MEEHRPSSSRPIKNHDAPERTAADVEESTPRAKDFEPVAPDYYKTKRNFHPFLVIIVLLLLALGAIYWFLIRAQPVKAPTKTGSTGTSQKSTTIISSTTHYESSSFNLGFDYPKPWKLTDESGSGKLSVVSPPMQLKSSSGNMVTGQAVMLMRDTTQTLPEFSKGNAAAVQDSEKISYTKPSQTQRADTYISFLSYANSADTGLDGIYITGDAGYQKNQSVPSTDVARIQPVIDVTFLKCGDSKCSGTGTPLTLTSAAWSDATFSKPIKTMLQSLSIQ